MKINPPSVHSCWIAIADVASLVSGTVREVAAGGLSLALVCTIRSAFVLDNACAHEGGALAHGSVSGTTVTCGSRECCIEAPTGRFAGDRSPRARTFDTKVERGQLWVRVPLEPRNAA